MIPALNHIVFSRPIDIGIGGSGLLTGMQVQGPAFDGAGFDFSYPDTNEQIRVRDTVTAANNYRGAAQGKLTYTSPSAKWVRNSSGLLASTGATTLPFEWDAAGVPLGLRCEEARTNICLQSQTFNSATWVKTACTIGTDAAVAPDAATTADKIIANSGAVSPDIRQTISVTSGAVYSVSCWIKAAGFTVAFITFEQNTQGHGAFAYFDLSAETFLAGPGTTYGSGATVTGTPAIENWGNGWYRISLVASITATSSIVRVGPSDADQGTIAGDGVKGIYVWQAQLELGSFVTSPIVTTTPSVTRAVDNITLATSAMPFSATVGSLYAKFRPLSTAAIRFAGAFDGAANNRISIGSSAAAAGYFSIIATSEQIGPMTAGTVTASADNKIAAGWVANRAEQATNGTLATVDTAVTLPTVTSLGFGTGSSAASPLNGWLMQLAYYKRTLADAEMQTLTRIL